MICGYCNHDGKKHCPGEVRHQNYKDAMRQVTNSRTRVCHTRHCEEPLCDCVELIEQPLAPSVAQAIAAERFGF